MGRLERLEESLGERLGSRVTGCLAEHERPSPRRLRRGGGLAGLGRGLRGQLRRAWRWRSTRSWRRTVLSSSRSRWGRNAAVRPRATQLGRRHVDHLEEDPVAVETDVPLRRPSSGTRHLGERPSALCGRPPLAAAPARAGGRSSRAGEFVDVPMPAIAASAADEERRPGTVGLGVHYERPRLAIDGEARCGSPSASAPRSSPGSAEQSPSPTPRASASSSPSTGSGFDTRTARSRRRRSQQVLLRDGEGRRRVLVELGDGNGW